METTFTELRSKEVINALTGKMLGNICDIVLDLRCNRILGFIVPGCKNFFNFFKSSQEIFIPFSHVCRIGEDIILVEVAEPPSKKQRNKPVRIFEAQNQQDGKDGDGAIYDRNDVGDSMEGNNANQHTSQHMQDKTQREKTVKFNNLKNQNWANLQHNNEGYNLSSNDFLQKSDNNIYANKSNGNGYGKDKISSYNIGKENYFENYDQEDIYPIN